MDDIKLFEIKYREKRVEYFKKEFYGKNANEVLHNVLKEIFKDFASLYLKASIVRDCVSVISEENTNNNKINKISTCLNSLCNKFEQILESDFQELIIKN